jgi:hypothetical protein
MATTIAAHYTDELTDWSRLIDFYNQEATEFAGKLAEVIRRNSIPDIGTKVEAHQDRFNAIMKMFIRLRIQIHKQEIALKTDSVFIDDSLINEDIEKKQLELRRNMQQTEKEFVDTKYACSDFLSGILKK